jgi:hypothetical protein
MKVVERVIVHTKKRRYMHWGSDVAAALGCHEV